jgi:O-succinylbenzoic acid--CoA ligase
LGIDKQKLLLEKLGVQPGDRIAACLPTGQALLELLLASIQIGAVFCPLNIRLPPAAIEEQLDRLKPKLIFSPSGYETKLSHPAPLLPSSLLLFTSGSTGAAKIASISLTSFLNNAKSANLACNLRAGDGWRLTLPMHHVAGLSIVFRCLTAGAKIILEEGDLTITHLSYVAAQLYRSWPIYPKLRCLLLGGGPIHDVPKELPCLVSYAMTETASLIMAGKSPNALWPLAGKEVKLAEDGEILVRGDSLFEGYWDGKALQSPIDVNGWFATKDLGRFNPTLGYTIVGRKDNQFISGGENIQPEEIEQELLKLPGVLEAIVGPRKHDRFGMRPIAFLNMCGISIDAAWIQNALAKKLPKYKIPDAFYPLDEPLSNPLKLDRRKIFNYTENESAEKHSTCS